METGNRAATGIMTKIPHKPENHARNRRQHFDQGNERLANPERSEFGQINRGRDAQGHGDDQGDERGNDRPVDKRKGAELLCYRIPGRSGKEMKPESLDREEGAARQLPADEKNKRTTTRAPWRGSAIQMPCPRNATAASSGLRELAPPSASDQGWQRLNLLLRGRRLAPIPQSSLSRPSTF